jgi:hypothetical protein
MPVFPDVQEQPRNLQDVIRTIQRMQNSRSLQLQDIAALPASGREGEIVYHANHFYGWDGTNWKQLDN